MQNYDYQTVFKELYDHAIKQYQSGNRDPQTYFDQQQQSQIVANGWRVIDFFDYAEDYLSFGEPSYEVAQSIEQARREYFIHEQKRIASSHRIATAELPAKTDAIDGIVWLPRLLPKARGKLLGELPNDIMYCCGGDRHFLKTHDIHPAEFLRVVWAHLDDDQSVIEFVKNRSLELAR